MHQSSAPKVVNLSLAAYPNREHFNAMRGAKAQFDEGSLCEPLWGPISLDHVQIVPQSRGVFGLTEASMLRDEFPSTQFRLHANVRVAMRRHIYDLSNFTESEQWFKQAAAVQHTLGGPVYSAHAGYRNQASLHEVLDNARRCADLFGCPVAIEGLYPERGATQKQNISTWDEYQTLLESGLPYALDLSHLNIVAKFFNHRNETLVSEMLASDACLEIHVSDNDGRGDQHQICSSKRHPWWLPLLECANPHAVIFSEGNHRRSMNPQGIPATQH